MKQVFTLKQNPNGSIATYKAKLVVKGFTQTNGINYHKTFSPVTKVMMVRILISLEATYEWPSHQQDANAFLHGDPKEEVFMSHPPSFIR